MEYGLVVVRETELWLVQMFFPDKNVAELRYKISAQEKGVSTKPTKVAAKAIV